MGNVGVLILGALLMLGGILSFFFLGEEEEKPVQKTARVTTLKPQVIEIAPSNRDLPPEPTPAPPYDPKLPPAAKVEKRTIRQNVGGQMMDAEREEYFIGEEELQSIRSKSPLAPSLRSLRTPPDAKKEMVMPYRPESAEGRWYYKTAVTDYMEKGSRNAVWDAYAIEALGAWVDYTRFGERCVDLIHDSASYAVKLGCNDPLVRYAQARSGMLLKRPLFEDDAISTAWVLVEAKQYHPARRSLTAVTCAKITIDKGRHPQRMVERSFDLLKEALEDPETPTSIIFQIGVSHFDLAGVAFPRAESFKRLKAILEPHPNRLAALKAIEGEYYIEWGWEARGTGWANTVTEEGWRLLSERLEHAGKALQQSWELDPTNGSAAASMITVCMGLSKSRPEMELWYQRAVSMSGNIHNAVTAKLQYLSPRWFGKNNESLVFGRECVEKFRSDPNADYVMIDAMLRAHEDCAALSNDSAAYYRDPAVWRDVKTALDLALERRPDSRIYLSELARWSYRTENWEPGFNALSALGDDPAFGILAQGASTEAEGRYEYFKREFEKRSGLTLPQVPKKK